MSVRFILGRSGAGKTSYCVKTIVESLASGSDGCRLIFLVPEQASYQAERSILSDCRITGYNHLNVLGFDRLQFMLLGKNTTKSNLSQIGRQMVVQRLLIENKENLSVFGQSAQRSGTASAIASTIKEMHQYGRGAEEIDELVETLRKYDGDSLTALKLSDISLLYKEYVKVISKSFIDTDMQLRLASEAVADSTLVKGSKLWIDGFAGFTASELAVLAELLQVSSEVNIALCLDAENIDNQIIDEMSLFGTTQRTYFDLLDIIKKRKLRLEKPIVLDNGLRFKNNKALGHIEKSLFEEKSKKIKANENIRIAALSDARSEVRYIAQEILRLIKKKKYRYRDIAVITSDIDCYEHYLKAYLEDYGVPYFIDKREKLSQHRVVGLLNTALAIVTEGFSKNYIFAYLKTNLTGINTFDIDVLENYCIAYGIRDKDWQEKASWNFAGEEDGFNDEEIDKIRRTVAKPLIALSKNLKSNDKLTAADFTRAIHEFLDGLSVWQQLNVIVEKALANGDNQKANLHQQFSERFWDIFDEMTQAFGDLWLSIGQFAEVLKSAFSQMTLAFIPPKLDQVLVGSIERSRHPDLKAVFLLGCSDRQFPVPVHYDSIISASDRQTIEQKDFELGPDLRDQLTNRQYLSYIAFTRASEKLYITFPLVDSRGGEVVYCRFIDNLISLFDDLKIEYLFADNEVVENITTKNELTELLCDKLGSESDIEKSEREKLQGLLESMASEKSLILPSLNIKRAVDYDNAAVLDEKISKQIYSDQIKVSATKLNSIASCPYQYFAKYILKLKKREEFKFEPLDKGLFYHKVLEAVVKKIINDGNDITELGSDKLKSLICEHINSMCKDDDFVNHFLNHSNHNAYVVDSMRQNLEDFIVALAEMVKAGDFRPEFAEVKFGDKDSELGQCAIEMHKGEKIILNGIIDRLDVAEIDGKKITAVFDYKSTERKFNYSKFYYGLDLQLPIYLLAVRNGNKSTYEPIGGFMVPVESAVQSFEHKKIENTSGKFSYKANGIFNGEYFNSIDGEISSGWSSYYNFAFTKKDGQYGYYKTSGSLKEKDFKKVLELAREKIIELVNQMLKGEIEISPYLLNNERPCQWCEFKSICRFDWQVNDYRILSSKPKMSVLGIESDIDER